MLESVIVQLGLEALPYAREAIGGAVALAGVAALRVTVWSARHLGLAAYRLAHWALTSPPTRPSLAVALAACSPDGNFDGNDSTTPHVVFSTSRASVRYRNLAGGELVVVVDGMDVTELFEPWEMKRLEKAAQKELRRRQQLHERVIKENREAMRAMLDEDLSRAPRS